MGGDVRSHHRSWGVNPARQIGVLTVLQLLHRTAAGRRDVRLGKHKA